LQKYFPILIHNIGHHATEYWPPSVAHTQWKRVGAWKKNVLRLQNMRIKLLPIHIFTGLQPVHTGAARACAQEETLAGFTLERLSDVALRYGGGF
jgi:hypothetical protein